MTPAAVAPITQRMLLSCPAPARTGERPLSRRTISVEGIADRALRQYVVVVGLGEVGGARHDPGSVGSAAVADVRDEDEQVVELPAGPGEARRDHRHAHGPADHGCQEPSVRVDHGLNPFADAHDGE